MKQNRTPAARRARMGALSGGIGIAVNTLLAAAKIALGAVTGALSVLADGMNNLTDCGSNVVSLIGLKMSEKPADKEHPFGHRRAETIAALVIALIVLVVAAELAIESVQKIFAPQTSDFSWPLIAVLAAAVAAKLFLFFFNRYWGKKLDAETLRATATDSISDAVATTAVIVSLVVSHYTNFDLDGYMGAAVAVFIAFSGGSILKEAVSRLLGTAPDAQVLRDIEARVRAFAGVHGLHDLTVHSYGQDKLYATVHVEVDAHMPLMATHDLADAIEQQFAEETNILLTVHIDPLVLDDPKVNRLREATEQAVRQIDPALRVHDFRLVGGETHANLVFDVAAPFECPLGDAQIRARIRSAVAQMDERLGVVVTVERQNLA